MELKHKDLQSLIERAWALQERINNEIEKISRHCKYCSKHGHYCGITAVALQEMESLSAIRDSLKGMEDMLMFFQRLCSWQILDRHSALTRLEESRSALIDNVKQHQGSDLDVLKELKSCFGHEKSVFNSSMRKELIDKKFNQRNGISGIVLCCFRFVIHPRKWHQAVAVAIKLLVVSVSISTSVSFIRSKQRYFSSRRRKVIRIADSRQKRGSTESVMGRPLDVFHGRG